MAHEAGDAFDAFGRGRHLMRLGVVHHLQAMFQLAVGAVMIGQFSRHLGGDPALRSQRLEAPQRGAVTQGRIAPARDQLAGLGEELDLADAALPQLDVVVLQPDGAMQAAVVADAQAHVMGVLDRGKVQMLAPDKGRERLEKPVARRDVARAGARLDIGRAFPCAALGLVIGLGRGHRQADGGHGGIGAQAQVGAEDVSFARQVRQHRAGAAGHADERGAGLLFVAPIAGFIEEADEVDVGGIVQLARPHLAHGQRDHAAGGLGILGRGAGQLAAADLFGHQPLQRQVHRQVGEIRQRAGHPFQRPHPPAIGQRHQQRHAPLGLPQPVGQRIDGQIRQGCRGRRQRGFGRKRQRHAQPGILARHQTLEIGAAAGDARQKARDFGAHLGIGAGGVGPRFGVEGDGLAGDAGGEDCVGHGRTLGRGAGGVNARRVA